LLFYISFKYSLSVVALKKETHTFSGKTVTYYFDADFTELEQVVSKKETIIITDEHVYAAAKNRLDGWKTIVIQPGEERKQQATADFIIGQLMQYGADRNTTVVGVGGGVITDITGYVAGVYMRGIRFGFMPTTILAMVDAAIGGKNGVDVGAYKNLVGLIRQPDFLLFDYTLLHTLPTEQWINGFAEVIKHACIRDAEMFLQLENHNVAGFRQDAALLADLIERNVHIKTAVVVADEFEKGDRKLLNFGHTLGHAIENTYELLHGNAVSIGMMAAAVFSEKFTAFSPDETYRLKQLLEKYQLPTAMEFDKQKIWDLLKMDKKKTGDAMNFILLNRIGNAAIHPIPLANLEQLIQQNL